MRTGFKATAIVFLFSLFTAVTYAQVLMPQPSSGQTIIQDFGLGKVTLNYSRPVAKGRVIFGGLVPYNAVWRTGANNATTLSFTDEVMIAGSKVPAGTYFLFTIPGKTEWTIVINKNPKQWGSYDYKKEDDVVNIKVKPVQLKSKVETFTIQFENVLPGSMDMSLAWENTQVNVPFTTDYDAKVMANIENAMKGDKKPYFPAAQYYYSHNKDLNQALLWVNEADKQNANAPWIKLAKAKIQLKMGDKKGAAATATEGLKIAQKINNAEYVKLNQAFLNDLK